MMEDPATTPFAQCMDRFEKLASRTSSRSTSNVSELPAALKDNCASFSCLQTSLRNVNLLFNTKKVNCFQVQLAKFLVENAMVLEEMHIDDGSQFWPEHLSATGSRDGELNRSARGTCQTRPAFRCTSCGRLLGTKVKLPIKKTKYVKKGELHFIS
jgi:hypothetical protein